IHLSLQIAHLQHESTLFPYTTLFRSGPQNRFPKYFSFDLRACKDLQVSKKYAVRLSLSTLNLTNHSNPLDVFANTEDPRYGTFFGNYPRRFLFDFDVLY